MSKLYKLAFLAALVSCSTTYKAVSTVKCHKYIVAFPKNDDSNAAKEIRDKWIQAVKSNLRKCDKILTDARADAALLSIDLHNEETITSKSLNREGLEKLTKDTGATDLVILRAKAKDKNLKIYPLILGPLPNSERQDPEIGKPVTIETKDMTAYKFSKEHPYAVRIFHLIPNAVEIGFSSSTLSNDRTKDQYKEDSVEHHGVLPPVISSISLTDIRPSNRYARFDFDALIHTALDFGYFDDSYVYSDANPPQGTTPNTYEYSIRLAFIAPTINGQLIFHTPIGTSFLDIGVGPALYNYVDIYGGATSVSSVFTLGVGHRIFATERFYFVISVNATNMIPPMVDNEIFKASGHGYGVIGVGYFWPEARLLARGAL